MKVLILTTVMAPYRVQLFGEIGKKCELVVCFEQQNDVTRHEDWYVEQCAGFRCIKLKKWGKKLKRIKFDIINVIKEEKPDVVVAYEYSTMTALIFMSCCKLIKIPYIINCDGAFIHKSLKDIIKKHYIKNSAACLASGEMAKKYFLNYGADERNIFYNNFTTLYKKDILPRCFTQEEKLEKKKDLNINQKRVILSIGRFVHKKGFDVLIKAASMLEGDVGIYIIGGKITEEYSRLIDEYKVRNVYFIDFTMPDRLREYYRVADLFVLPTREDIWGLVVNEAMASGLPVITTDKCISGLELIENGKNGYIIPVDDINALKKAIENVLSDEGKKIKMGEYSLLKILPYNIEQSAEMIFEMLKEVNGNTKCKE